MNKRKIKRFFFNAIFVCLCFGFVFNVACGKGNSDNLIDENEAFAVFPEIKSGVFSVHFLYVKEGDSAIINFPDDKIMLIDSGEYGDKTAEYVVNCLKMTGKNKIDYLLLTHTDSDHAGNIPKILEDFSVGTAYLPFIEEKAKFPYYNAAFDAISDKADEIVYSSIGQVESGENWFFRILWPSSDDNNKDLNIGEPTADETNYSSAVLYLSYLGVRFLFTGDASSSALEEVRLNYLSGLYSGFLRNGKKIDFDKIEFYKAPHHGSSDGVNAKLLALLRPKYAVVSVGAGNKYNHPSSECSASLLRANKNVKIFRTDVYGTISAEVDASGSLSVKPSFDMQE